MVRAPSLAIIAALALAGCAGGSNPPKVASHTARNADMVLIPGGKVQIGDNASQADERPAFTYDARPVLMDRTPVTVAQFAAFVAETGYVTEAERFGESNVFEHDADAWVMTKGATWRRPQGPRRPAAPADHPVTQVSWNDATAFCAAYGARLPTEFEWERAARLGQTPDGHVFGMGEAPLLSNAKVINVWQGAFPIYDSGVDGYKLTSPVGKFGTAPSGLTDMAGNVWEWTSSWYRPYGQRDWKPTETSHRVQRGGSFLCDPTLCAGFRASARAHATADSALMHVGFRCVTDPERPGALAGRIVTAAKARTPSA